MFMPEAISPSPVRAVLPLSPANRRRLSCRHFVLEAQQMHSIAFTVNGKPASFAADPDTPLLDVLRNHLGLVGTKFGCGLEQCGTCMVLIDGEPVKSCGKAVSTVVGKAVLTIEGLGTPERPHPLQQAFLDEQAGQCGYCLPGILGAEQRTRTPPPASARALRQHATPPPSHHGTQ